MTKEKVIAWLWSVSAGTMAQIIGSTKYSVIDAACSKAILYASSLPEAHYGDDFRLPEVWQLVREANGLA